MKIVEGFIRRGLFVLFLYAGGINATVTYEGENGIKARIFDSNSVVSCASCHFSGNSGGYSDLSTYSKLYNVRVTASDYISTGYMPYSNSDLNANEKSLIAQWVSDGGLENAAPTAHPSSVLSISGSGATLVGTIDPNGAQLTDFYFQYSTTNDDVWPNSANSTAEEQSAVGSGGGGTSTGYYSVATVSKTLTGLSCATTYYWRLLAENVVGLSPSSVSSFTTSDCNNGPTITTTALNSATEQTAFLQSITVSDPEGDDITFGLTAFPDGMAIDANTGVISWTPTAAQSGLTHNVTITATDNNADNNPTASLALTIDVTAVNDTPIISSTPDTEATEDETYTYNVLVSDEDDTSFSFSLLSKPDGMVIDANSGVLTWLPVNGQTTSGTVIVQVSDNDPVDEQTATQNFTINVTAVNDAPVFTSTAVSSVAEDDAYVYNVVAVDEENDDLNFAMVNGPGFLVMDPETGVLSGTPVVGDVGVHSIEISVSDGSLSQSQSFDLTVTNVNDAPVITSSQNTTAQENVDYQYTLVATDEELETLTYSLVNGPEGMVINSESGEVNWLPPAASENYMVNVEFSVSDGTSFTAQSFDISVSVLNDAPEILSEAIVSATENQDYLYQLTIIDPDDDIGELTVSLTQAPEGMTVTASGLIEWQPSDEQNGDFDVTVSVADGGEDGTVAATQNFTITVTAVNDGPVITSLPSTSTARFVEYQYQVEAQDIDTDSADLTFQLTADDPTVDMSTSGLIRWTPGANATTSGTISIAVSDDGSDGAVPAVQEFEITVFDFNVSPEIVSAAITTATEDVLYQYQVEVEDLNDQNNGIDLSFSLTNAPTTMTISATGLIEWTPQEGDEQALAVSVSVADGGEDDSQVAVQTFDILVTAVNDAPTITSTPATTAVEGTTWQYQLTYSDPDDESLDVTITSLLGDALIFDNNVLSWTPTEGGVNTAEITISVADGGEDGAQIATQQFTVTVSNINQGPSVAAVSTLSATEDLLYQYQLQVSDPDDQVDGSSITFTLDAGPDGLTISNMGLIEWRPNEGQLSSGEITITVADGGENDAVPAVVQFTITVTPVNDAPQITSSPVLVAHEEQSYEYLIEYSDVDSTLLTLVLEDGPDGMALDGDRLLWTPETVNSESVTIAVGDGQWFTRQSFAITVIGVDDPPEFVSTPITIATEDQVYRYPINVFDEDSLELQLTLLTGPQGMTLSDNELLWQPVEGQLLGTVVLSANDGNSTVLQSFDVVVSAVNDPPELIGPELVTMNELQSYQQVLLATDVDSEQITYSLSNAPDGMQVDANGVITWLAGQFSAGNYTVTAIADDGANENNRSTITFSLIVLLVDEDGDQIADYIDNCPFVANQTQLDTDANGSGNVCDDDDDGDGLSDVIEMGFGLDPLNPLDADLDLDQDGLSNLDEYQLCVSNNDFDCQALNFDSVGPIITVTQSQVTAVSKGPLTTVNLTATAVDAIDGVVDVKLDNAGPYTPGRHQLFWQARDHNGNQTLSEQIVDVLPLVSLKGTQLVAESQMVSVNILLNGEAPEYPVTVGFTVSGSAAAEDTTLRSGEITITEGKSASLPFEVIDDQVIEGDEELIITLTEVSGAAVLHETANSRRYLIVENNVAPQLTLHAEQNGISGFTLVKTQAPIVVTAELFDPNGDDLAVTFELADGITFKPLSDQQIEIIPNDISGNTIRVTVSVTDGLLTTRQSQRIKVLAAAPALSAVLDSDNDGINDLAEGYGDDDNDNVANYLDAIEEPDILAAEPSATEFLTVDGGLSLKLGELATGKQNGSPKLNPNDIVDALGQTISDDSFTVIGDIFDFEIAGLNEYRRQANVVIPLSQPIPLNASYRKFDGSQWRDFVIDSENDIASGPKIDDVCPAADSDSYRSGLTAFDHCLRLTLSDGGPNDADGIVNGVILDPGAMALANSELNVSFKPALEKPTEQPKGGSSMSYIVSLMALIALLLKRYGNLAIGARAKPILAKQSNRNFICVVTSTILALISTNLWADGHRNWSIHADVGSFYDSNVGKAQRLRDTVEDEVIYANGQFQYTIEPSRKSLLTLGALVETQKYDTLTALDSFVTGLSVAYSWQNDFGFSAPFYRSSLTYKHEEQGAGRSSDSIKFQTFVTRRISTDFTGRLGYEFNNVMAQNEVFDNAEHRVFANLDYDWSQTLVSYFTASVINGDIYSVAQVSFCNGLAADDIYPVIRDSLKLWRDKAFNQHFCGDWFAYRLEAVTQTYALGVNYAINHKYSVDVSSTWIDSTASKWVDYQRLFLRASLLVRF